jgi:MFS family permease
MTRRSYSPLPLLFSISFLGQFSMAAVNLALIFYVKQRFLLEPKAIGLLTSLCPVSYFTGLLLFRRLSSRMRPPLTILTASSGMALSGILILAVDTVAPVFILYTLYGLSMALYWPPIMGWLSRGTEGRGLGGRVARFNVSWSSGIILGPYVAGLLAESGARSAVWGANGAMLAVLAASAAALGVRQFRDTPSAKLHRESGADQGSGTPLRFICWIGIFYGYAVFGVISNVFPVYAQDLLGLSEGSIGLMLLIRALVTTVLFLVLGNCTFWHFRLRCTFGFQLLLVLSLGAALLVPNMIGLTLFLLLFGAAFAGLYTGSIFHGAAGSRDREQRMAIHEASLTAGLILGTLSGSWIYQNRGFSAALTAALVLVLTAAAVQIILSIRTVRPVSG